MSNVSLYNIFIFNFINNNRKDIELIQKTFEELDCIVKLIDLPTRKQFHEEVEYIANKSFTIYQYVAVIVLANTNPGDDVLLTADKEVIFLNRDLVNYIDFNDTLRLNNIKLLVVQQINQNVLEDDIFEDLVKNNPLQSGDVPGKWRSNASRQHTRTKLTGITIRLSASHSAEKLDNYWDIEEPPVNPFIQAFCDNFARYSMTEGIEKIYKNIFYYMEKHCKETPALDKPCDIGPCIFGSPFLNLDLKRDYIMPQLRRMKRLNK